MRTCFRCWSLSQNPCTTLKLTAAVDVLSLAAQTVPTAAMWCSSVVGFGGRLSNLSNFLNYRSIGTTKDKLVIYIYNILCFCTSSLYLFPIILLCFFSTFRTVSSLGSLPPTSQMQRSKSESAICAPRLPGWRLPREGPEDGGGRMKVMDRTMGGMMGWCLGWWWDDDWGYIYWVCWLVSAQVLFWLAVAG